MMKRTPVKNPQCFGEEWGGGNECKDCLAEKRCRQIFMTKDHTQKKEVSFSFSAKTIVIFVILSALLVVIINHFFLFYMADPYSDCCASDYWLMARDHGYNDALAGLNYPTPEYSGWTSEGYNEGFIQGKFEQGYSHYKENILNFSNSYYRMIQVGFDVNHDAVIYDNNISKWVYPESGEIVELEIISTHYIGEV